MTDKEPGTPRVRDVLVCVLVVQVVFALSAGAALILDPASMLDHPGVQLLTGSLIVMPIVMATVLALRFRRNHRAESIRSLIHAQLMDTVLRTSRDWVWAVNDQGIFTFSNPASATMLGWLPADLIGRHCNVVIEPADLARSWKAVQTSDIESGSPWTGAIVRCRHRDGTTVWMDVTGTLRQAREGQRVGFEGTGRPLPPESAQAAAASESRTRILAMIDQKLLLTAFQPIHDLTTGHFIGVEALTRFVEEDGVGAEYWFAEAALAGLVSDLDFAALETALEAALCLPPSIYVALNISPSTCLDPRLPGLLKRSGLPLKRIVLELTERLEVSEYTPLISALKPLRQRGLRIAVDDAGSGFASMRHILHVRPDIIKLDRSLIAGIDDNQGQLALGAALAEFARQIGATLVAEGIETPEELAAVAGIGMTAGHGYLIGRPSVHPRDWAAWYENSDPGSRRRK